MDSDQGMEIGEESRPQPGAGGDFPDVPDLVQDPLMRQGGRYRNPPPAGTLAAAALANCIRPRSDYYGSHYYPELPDKDNSDWQYVMRRTMQEIIPGLYLGPYAAATRAKLEDMQRSGITHVVCVRETLERNLIRPNHPDYFQYLVIEVADSTTANIIPEFKKVNEFIRKALERKGTVLVHGNAGISRSATLVIAFIMERYGVTTKDAYTFVQSKRFCSNPNEGFLAQLREYEPIYRAMHVVPLELPGTSRTSSKRSLEDEPESMETMEPRHKQLS